MGFFIFSAAFGCILLLSVLLTIYTFLRLVTCVTGGKEIPGWIYKIGQSFQGRIHIKFDDVTEPIVLWHVIIFILVWIVDNYIYINIMSDKIYDFNTGLYTCLKAQFFIVLVTLLIHRGLQFVFVTLMRSDKPKRLYSAENAIIALIFFSCFILTLFISMVGFPAKPVSVQLDKSTLTIGKTKASALLADGFTFADKNADSEILNKRDDHFYYGEFTEIFYGGRSYGFVSVTPTWKDSDKLENCVITYYETPEDSEVLSSIKFNDTDLSKLSIEDFRNKHLTNIFSLDPFDYKETRQDTFYTIRMQNAGYELWTSYSILANFHADGSIDYYGVRAQHSIWE